jgi:hypothetical protein
MPRKHGDHRDSGSVKDEDASLAWGLEVVLTPVLNEAEKAAIGLVESNNLECGWRLSVLRDSQTAVLPVDLRRLRP